LQRLPLCFFSAFARILRKKFARIQKSRERILSYCKRLKDESAILQNFREKLALTQNSEKISSPALAILAEKC